MSCDSKAKPNTTVRTHKPPALHISLRPINSDCLGPFNTSSTSPLSTTAATLSSSSSTRPGAPLCQPPQTRCKDFGLSRHHQIQLSGGPPRSGLMRIHWGRRAVRTRLVMGAERGPKEGETNYEWSEEEAHLKVLLKRFPVVLNQLMVSSFSFKWWI